MSFTKDFNLLKHPCSIAQSILQTNPDNQNTKGLDCQINEYLIGQVLLVSLLQVSPRHPKSPNLETPTEGAVTLSEVSVKCISSSLYYKTFYDPNCCHIEIS
jgi:hypothetical protein